MSSYVWSLKEAGEEPVIAYRTLRKARPYTPTARKCALCTAEKVLIAKGDDQTMLNKKSEISGKCRHRTKHLLAAAMEYG